MKQLIECVPNFSEGRDLAKIEQITNEIKAVSGVKLLDVDPGRATNRTVVTFVGEPEAVIEAAFRAIKKASEIIDMRQHQGEHPRFGATDVCPLIPIANISMEETVRFAHKLAQKVGIELGIPVYLYEAAASRPERKNLANIRAGEYEGLAQKMANPNWAPDAGGTDFNEKVARTGATVIGARDFLIAYNVNLNTTSTRRANAIAFDVREKGRVKRKGGMAGTIVRQEDGTPVRVPGKLKHVKAIGWFIEEYGIAQISMNLTNINVSPVHLAFDEVCNSAQRRGLRVTGSELVGLIPLNAILEAGRYFLKKQKRSVGVSDAELIKIAVKSMGLDELGPFDPKKKIIEYMIEDQAAPLANQTLIQFMENTASESPAPGGGSVSAYVGSLGIALGTMVANLSSHKRGWDKRWKEFSDWAEKGKAYQTKLLQLVDEDTNAFNQIIAAIRLPKNTAAEQKARNLAIQEATKNAIQVPYTIMETAYESMQVLKAMAEVGNPNSVSDAGVGAACARTAVLGAYLNVLINSKDLADTLHAEYVVKEAKALLDKASALEKEILVIVEEKIA